MIERRQNTEESHNLSILPPICSQTLRVQLDYNPLETLVVNATCYACGKQLFRSQKRLARTRRAFCSQACYHSVRQDGRYRANRQGQRVARKVVSKYFDLQPEHIVHHEDRDNKNNDPANLRVFRNQSEHMAYHHGNPSVKPIWDGRAP